MSILSLVVPAKSLTTYLSSPSKALINEDFPALGLPTTAKPGISSFWTDELSGIKETRQSSSSPVPEPFIALKLKTNSNPSEWNSVESNCLLELSTLFTASNTFLSDLWRSLEIS